MIYNTTRILAQDHLASNNTRATNINNNDLIIGPTGAGKTRNYVKPNLLQCALEGSGSLIVTDTKGSLIQEVGPVLAAHGYNVMNLDFINLMNSQHGYNPLDYVRYDPVRNRYSEQDIIRIAACLVPIDDPRQPYWELSAQTYLYALIAYVLEALPKEEHTMESIFRLYPLMRQPEFEKLFQERHEEDPDSFAYRAYCMSAGNEKAERAFASVMMILSKNLMPLSFDGTRRLCSLPERVDFRRLSREKTALFLTVSDTDRSMDKLSNLFYTQALQALCDIAAAEKDNGYRLPVPVRFILDDFATNVRIPDFDKVISVIRSREISVSLIVQSINQLSALYGSDCARTIINNCDSWLYLGGQDIDTAEFLAIRTSQTPESILSMPIGDAWLFLRGRKAQQVRKYNLLCHPLYSELPEAGSSSHPPVFEDVPEAPRALQVRPQPQPSMKERWRQLVEKAARLEWMLSGQGLPTLPELLDNTGRYSEEKTDALSAQLLEAVEASRQEQGQPEFSSRERSCLRDFLYCALRLSASRPPWLSEVAGNFQDLLSFARQMCCTTRTQLHFHELYPDAVWEDSFFSRMDEIYSLLSGTPITDQLSAMDRQLVDSLYKDEIEDLQDDLEIDWPDVDSYIVVDTDDFIPLEPEEQESVFETFQVLSEGTSRQDWASAFPNPDAFCQRYLTLRKLYFETGFPETLPQIVEQALDIYLQDQAQSLFLNDDAYTAACELLDETEEQLRRQLGGQG